MRESFRKNKETPQQRHPPASPLDNTSEANSSEAKPQGLHICAEGCGCDMVYPVDWDETGPDSWQIHLRCPNCEDERTVVAGDAAVEIFDRILDVGTMALIGNLRQLERQNFLAKTIVAIDAYNSLQREHFVDPRSSSGQQPEAPWFFTP